ncbi:MAG: NTP transferase domain-containing protein [Kiritimatiellae bacterium]|nr:NTP transferase domain-containing protein [Kiritimatiellia bacterium]MCB1102306.1 NTP transferase domain-containing protein [Kiritimatiellia bacterium]
MTKTPPRTTLVILAAGMGSRYGGLKQVEPVGPHGEIVLEYSLFDALRAGFRKAVIVIRRDMEKAFREAVGHRIEPHIEVHYAFQELNDLPAPFACPPERGKPWGTGHAVYAARRAVKEPFAVINADDFYGPIAYRLLGRFLQSPAPESARDHYAMIGFALHHTLSDHGTVSRGICETDRNGQLLKVQEYPLIEKDGDNAVWRDGEGVRHALPGDRIASMNFWGFQPSLFPRLEQEFTTFLNNRRTEPKAEFYLPATVDNLIKRGEASVQVAVSPDQWLGVTYREDAPLVIEGIRQRIRESTYPPALWA